MEPPFPWLPPKPIAPLYVTAFSLGSTLASVRAVMAALPPQLAPHGLLALGAAYWPAPGRGSRWRRRKEGPAPVRASALSPASWVAPT